MSIFFLSKFYGDGLLELMILGVAIVFGLIGSLLFYFIYINYWASSRVKIYAGWQKSLIWLAMFVGMTLLIKTILLWSKT
jgi:hypothetical protein